jgi:beta-galactosidase
VAFGVTDIWRIPKESYYLYQSQWSSKPMVHIFGHWTWPGQEGPKRKVMVFSNAPQVELFLGGRSLGIKEDKAADDLTHPARVWEVDYQPGTLRAVARSGGQEISDERRTAGPAYQIILKSDAKELRSGDPESLAYITAIVADKNGTPVPDAAQAISFTSYGPGELLPQTWVGHGTGFTWNVVGGMTRIAFRSTPRTGTATISAVSQGLKMGRTTVMISAPGKPDEMQFKEHFDAKEDEETGVRGDETPGPGGQK